MPSRRFRKLFDRLADADRDFLTRGVLAPAVGGGTIHTRIAGVVCRLRITPPDFEGWGIFRPTSHSSAELVRAAGLAERRRYLDLFPLVRLILCARRDGLWLARPAHEGDRRFRIDGLVPVRLAEDAQQFEIVQARFDGANFWFDSADPARDPATAAYLRRALNDTTAPNLLDRPGLTPEERSAYALNYCLKEEVRQRHHAELAEQKLREALRHAGAELVEYVERRDGYRVTWTAGGRQHVSAVRKGDLAVQVAGICLSGQDRQFDLTSLVGVIREAEGAGGYVPVGRENAGIDEQQYWEVHPAGRHEDRGEQDA
ncbi:MAG TPA: hypothetical protein VML55_26480 [Planctomycetaceae bacterium]|nr:hypothetical protein [Planctomycetaceae bacterium]